MKRKKTIIYTGNFDIETMNAAGKRVFSNALIMKELGYHMVMLGVDNDDTTSIDIASTFSFKNEMEIFHYSGKLFKNKRANYIAFYKEFERLVNENDWDICAVICYNSPSTSLFMGKIIDFCHRHNIKYITDVADWLIVDSDNLFFRVLRQFDITLKNAYYSNKSDGVVAISTWLEKYYKKKVNHVIIVPPLAIRKFRNYEKRTEEVKIVYAGLPFRKNTVMFNSKLMKDRFDVACKLLAYAKNNGACFKFQVFGFSEKEIMYSIPNLSPVILELGDSVVFNGMKSMEDVQKAVRGADYTILIREKNRMTDAGFPTKVSESIMCGTPVITTRTSDIDKYLREECEVFFVDADDNDFSKKKVLELLKRSTDERFKQKMSCENNCSFDTAFYEQIIDDFLKKVCGAD